MFLRSTMKTSTPRGLFEPLNSVGGYPKSVFMSAATRFISGVTIFRRSTFFACNSTNWVDVPVRFRSGRARLLTKPRPTGSPTEKTIGIRSVAFFAASAAHTPRTTITSTSSAINRCHHFWQLPTIAGKFASLDYEILAFHPATPPKLPIEFRQQPIFERVTIAFGSHDPDALDLSAGFGAQICCARTQSQRRRNQEPFCG